MTLPQHHPAMPTLGVAEAAGNSSGVDVDQQLLNDSAGGDKLRKVQRPDVNRFHTSPDASAAME